MSSSTPIIFSHLLVQKLCNLLSLNTFFVVVVMYGFLLVIAVFIEICFVAKLW